MTSLGHDKIHEILEKIIETLSNMDENDNPWEENEEQSDYPTSGEWIIVYDWNQRASERFHHKLKRVSQLLEYLNQKVPKTPQKSYITKV